VTNPQLRLLKPTTYKNWSRRDQIPKFEKPRQRRVFWITVSPQRAKIPKMSQTSLPPEDSKSVKPTDDS
jgi:hypothetical protein